MYGPVIFAVLPTAFQCPYTVYNTQYIGVSHWFTTILWRQSDDGFWGVVSCLDNCDSHYFKVKL